MSRNIVPRVDKGADLGTQLKNWNRLYADAIFLRGNNLEALLNNKADFNMLTAKGDMYVATEAGMVTRLPAGTDGYVLKSNSGDPKGVMWGPAGARQELTANLSVSVGSGGDFPTINTALENIVSLYYPKYISGSNVPRVTINLMPDFVMSEQIIVDSLDLSWITITGYDDETPINVDALTRFLGNSRPALGAGSGGFLPIIGQLFNMNATGSNPGRHGLMVINNSRAIVLSGCGVKNAAGYGFWVGNNSIVNANSAIASGSYDANVYAAYGSIINASGMDATNGYNRGIFASEGSIINATGADTTGAGVTGFRIWKGSIINAYNSTGTLDRAANTISADGIIFK